MTGASNADDVLGAVGWWVARHLRQSSQAGSVWRAEHLLSADTWTPAAQIAARMGLSLDTARLLMRDACNLGAHIVCDRRLGYRLTTSTEVKP